MEIDKEKLTRLGNEIWMHGAMEVNFVAL